jgi:ferritin-like metal-binding protein YciE
MGLLTPNDIQNFKSLYTLEMRYLLSTENQIVKGLETMIEAAEDQQLKDAFQSHLQETEVQAGRVRRILEDLEGKVDDKKCPVTAALIAAGANLISESDPGPVRDAGLIASAQKIEHFEQASYGSVRDWATRLGYPEHAALLEKTLEEEKHADALLSTIAERANQEAAVTTNVYVAAGSE